MTEMTTRDQQLVELDIMKEIHRICEKNGIKYYIMYGSLIGAIRHKGFIPWDDDIDLAMKREDYNKFLLVCPKELKEGYLLQNYDTDPHFEFTISRVCKEGTYSDTPARKFLKGWKYCYVDIFPLDVLPDDPEKQKEQREKLKKIMKLLRYRVNYYYSHQPFLMRSVKMMFRLPFRLIPLRKLVDKKEEVMMMHDGEITKHIGAIGNTYDYNKEIQLAEDFDERILVPFEDTEFYIPAGYDRILRNLYGDYMKLPPESERVSKHKAYFV